MERYELAAQRMIAERMTDYPMHQLRDSVVPPALRAVLRDYPCPQGNIETPFGGDVRGSSTRPRA